jgi:hypothetical protein
MTRIRLACCILVAALLALAPRPAHAQIGSATDIITGVVIGEDGQPVQDATIEAWSVETQVTRRARTDARGRFTILFPDGGGQYRMTVRMIGMNPRIEMIQRTADEDRLVWNVRLAGGGVTLDAINVSGARLNPNDGPTPGSDERRFTADQLSRLPTDATDLMSLAGLVPGVLTISSTDTTATAFSVAGLGPDANALTLDGLLFGNSTIPQEGLRATRVVTNTYDVSLGQFSGGLISSTTRSGSNVVQGSSQYQLRDENLAVTGDSSAYAAGFTQNVLSGGVGGPLIKDKLFLFVSGQARLRSNPQQTLLSAQNADDVRLGVSPDSVARFYHLVDSLGIPHTSVSGAAAQSNDNYSALARMDYVLSNDHSITLRGDWRGTSQDPTRLGALALPQTAGQMTSGGGGLMGVLTSHFGATVLNELRGYYQGANNGGTPFTLVPSGRVQVASSLPDGTVGVTTLAFGGNNGLPTQSRSNSFEASDEVSWLPGTGAHRIKIGGSLLTETAHSIVGGNTLGTFTYNSLGALAAGTPASFSRTLNILERNAADSRWSAYVGDVWVVARPFQLTYGVRAEGSAFGDLPGYNATVDSAFGRRTDYLPNETHFSPRAGFTWTLGSSPAGGGPGGGPGGGGGGGGFGGGGFRQFSAPTLVIRGGIGEFRSQPSAGLAAQARSATGLPQSAAEIVCAGGGVPTPDWGQYWTDQTDPSTIPSDCVSAGPPPPSGFAIARPVSLFAPGFEASRAWRASLGIEKRLTQLFRFTLEGAIARGVAQTGYQDLNLNLANARGFTLPSEGNRPVYVGVQDITPTTGATRLAASRLDTLFGRVIEASSNLQSRSFQITTGIGGVVGPGIQLQLSYTWQRASDEQSGTRGGSTAGDPNVIEWARSDFERQHSFLATITYPVSQSVEITSIGRVTSGAPFTPMVGGDVNGDGSRNDRAFIFTPGTATAEALAMQQLLAVAPSGVRSCLLAQLGTVALRNSCTGPWQGTLDFQLNWRPAMLGLNRRLTVSVVTVNFLHGLDELLHGVNGEQGWGLTTRPDNTLLYVVGFDSTARRYTYQVNERFGATYGSANAFRPPFQIGIQMRMTIGPDRVRQALDAMRGGGARGFGGIGFRGPVFSLETLISRIDSVLPNPAGVVLGMRDSLGLDSTQVQLLEPMRDSLAYRNRVRVDSLRIVVQGAGNNPDLARLMPTLRPLFTDARNDVAQSLVTVRAILRPEQWAKVPESVRNFQAQAPRPGQGQGGVRRFERP